ncbi:hypothetical protein DYB38_001706, partial [Aphanomyces astaci]
MASRYAKNIKVPAEFPEMLRNFAREVLRHQDKIKTRDDILQYGIRYFTEVTEKNAGVNNGAQDEKEVYMTMSDDEIEEYMWQIFRASDPGSVGNLDEGDFKKNIESHDVAGASKELVVETSNSLSHGLLREEFESLLREILHNIDIDNTGTLTRADFMGCLQVKPDADLGLTRKETNLVLFDTP